MWASLAPAAAWACVTVTPAVCCDPPGFASWLPGGLCVDAGAWPRQWAQHPGDFGEKWASFQEGTAVGTGLCVHAAAWDDHILLADSCWHHKKWRRKKKKPRRLKIIIRFHFKKKWPSDTSDHHHHTQQQAKRGTEWMVYMRTIFAMLKKWKLEVSAWCARGDAFQPLSLREPRSDVQAAVGSVILQPFPYNVPWLQIFIPLSTRVYLKKKKKSHIRNSNVEEPSSVTVNPPHCCNKLNIFEEIKLQLSCARSSIPQQSLLPTAPPRR